MVYFVTVITENEKARCLGVFQSYNEARNNIQRDGDSLHEYLYDYLVIEEFNYGLHPISISSWWWKLDASTEEWKQLKFEEVPIKFKNKINWAIG